MGEPAIPSDKQRASTRALAAKIVESVRADEAMPHGLESDGAGLYRVFLADDVEDLVFRLAQEIELLHTQFGEALDLTSTPEHAQDDEWYAKQRELMAAWRGEP